MELQIMPQALTVCKVASDAALSLEGELVFIGKTDEERSLVCPTERTPPETIAREDGWRCFRIRGVLDFSLIGVLAPIAELLAAHRIGIFVVSTYNTDYIMVKEENLDRAAALLRDAGYAVR